MEWKQRASTVFSAKISLKACCLLFRLFFLQRQKSTEISVAIVAIAYTHIHIYMHRYAFFTAFIAFHVKLNVVQNWFHNDKIIKPWSFHWTDLKHPCRRLPQCSYNIWYISLFFFKKSIVLILMSLLFADYIILLWWKCASENKIVWIRKYAIFELSATISNRLSSSSGWHYKQFLAALISPSQTSLHGEQLPNWIFKVSLGLHPLDPSIWILLNRKYYPRQRISGQIPSKSSSLEHS